MLIDVSDDNFDIVRRNSVLMSQRTSIEQEILKNCLSLQSWLFGQKLCQKCYSKQLLQSSFI